MAERLLGVMLELECISEDILHGLVLTRYNEKCRQPWGSNLCGHFVLAYAEQEVLEHLGYGPAAIGWPEHTAHDWHQRLQKLTLALKDEKGKFYKDLVD
eukprot:s2679_g15.t1